MPEYNCFVSGAMGALVIADSPEESQQIYLGMLMAELTADGMRRRRNGRRMSLETCLSVGVCVRPEDEARLTAIIESMQANQPGTSDDECVDLIFRIGMEMAGSMLALGLAPL